MSSRCSSSLWDQLLPCFSEPCSLGSGNRCAAGVPCRQSAPLGSLWSAAVLHLCFSCSSSGSVWCIPQVLCLL
jgi:hypothetical protein